MKVNRMTAREIRELPIPTDVQLEAARKHWSAVCLTSRSLTTSGLIINEYHGKKFIAFDRDGNTVNDRFI